MLEARPEDLAWEKGRWYVKGDPEKGSLIEEIAARAYSGEAMPEGMEGGLDAQVIYDPPNLTYPYGAYIAVVDIDPDTGHVTVRRFIAVDDCGVRINPMVVDGQIHGGLAEGVGIALMELISFDEEGNCLNSSFMDYLIPTALECPDFELGETVTPCPHHPLGAKGVGESPNVGSPPAIVNAVIDALHASHGVEHLDMPCTPARVWARHARASRATAMMSAAVSRRAQELAAQGTVFVTATVVRAQRPTSVNAGDVALVLADGTIEGFIGGVCAQQSVRVYALKAIQSEEALLLRIVPDGPIGEDPSTGQEVPIEEGAVTARNTCLSGGTIEIFLEPVLPAPRVLVVGDTPIAGAILSLGAALGLDPVAVEGGAPEPSAADLALVVAAHGRDELHTLRLGLEAGVPYIGLVASPKRGAGVLAELRADGVAKEHLDVIDVPAGLDIGAQSPGEIALSILASIVAVRRGKQASAPAAAASAPSSTAATPGPTLAVDPICGMTVAAIPGTPSVQFEGETIYFCCEGCLAKFEAQHEHAVAAE